MRRVRETIFRVEPVGDRWQLRRDRTLLYSHGDRQRVVDNGETTAKGNRPSRFVVVAADRSIESETRYDLDLTVHSEGQRWPVSLDVEARR